MFAYCVNNPVCYYDPSGNSPFGRLTLADYKLIHLGVQLDCAFKTSWQMEVFVRSQSGKIGFLDLYDLSSNAYYEVKSKGAASRITTELQMRRYDKSLVKDKRFSNNQITNPPSRGTQNISGSFPYGIWDVEYETARNGLIRYETNLNPKRVTVAGVLAIATIILVVSDGSTAPAMLPVLSWAFEQFV